MNATKLIISALMGGIIGFIVYKVTGSILIEVIVCLAVGFVIGILPIGEKS